MKKNVKLTNQTMSLLSLTFLLTLLLSLTACGSSQDAQTPLDVTSSIEESVNIASIDSETPPTITTEATEEISEPETIIEELYIPEGVDIHSTLSGQEWLDSFIGIVNEPVVVVFNDNTGRKEVVQADSEIEINPDEDRIGIYFMDISMGATTHAISVKELLGSDCYDILVMDSEKMRNIPERPAKVRVMGSEKDWILEFTILVQ